jgi:probable F420-dependent oxidoreductase
MELGRYGIWSAALRGGGGSDGAEVADAARELEELGYGAVWIGGSSDVASAAALIGATSSLTVATGILSIWDHPAAEVAAEQAALRAAHPGRFLLGLGASHAKLAGAAYRRPYSTMVQYLDTLDAHPAEGAHAGARAPSAPADERVLAALGPKMLRLAGDRAAGAHPYLVDAEHTARARAELGDGPLLAPELKVVLESDPGRALAIARETLAFYMELPNYTANFRRLGFGEDDFRDGGSDRLVDAMVAWGDEDRVRRRIDEFFAAGADHLALQVLTGPGESGLPRDGWRRLAGLLGLNRN